ncbi:Uncharacterised protein [Yersinia pseudotuberculosis]|nr:Uncharacterised protein [Yersinia pseudotuberculosis]
MTHRLHILRVFIWNAGNGLGFAHHRVKFITHTQRFGYPPAHGAAGSKRGITQPGGYRFALIAGIKAIAGGIQALLLLGLLR